MCASSWAPSHKIRTLRKNRGGSVRRLVDEPIVNKLVPTLDDLANTIGARCCDLAGRQTEISSRTNFA